MLILTLALCILFISGAALLAALLVSRKSRVALDRRVNLVSRSSRPQMSGRISAAMQAPTAFITAERVRIFFTLGRGYNWGMQSGAASLFAIAFAAAAATWLLASTVLNFSPWIALLATGAAFMLIPRALLMRQQARTENQFMTLFPDAIDMAVRMLRAGLPITAAIRSIGNEAPTPVNGIFKALGDQVEIGIPFEEALALTGDRIGLTDFRFFATAVALQRATGGNLAATLEILGDIIRKRRAVRLKAKATTAEVRVSAYILGAMPFLVIAALLIAQPGYLAPLVSDPRGNFISGLAIVMLTIAFSTMRQMMRSA